jgi:hypothetical protein
MRKGEPKVEPKTDQPTFRKGRMPKGPELPHATCTPDCTMPSGTTLPRVQAFPGFSRQSSLRMLRRLFFSDLVTIQGRVTGKETQVVTL